VGAGHDRRWRAGRSPKVEPDAFQVRLSGCSPHIDKRKYQKLKMRRPVDQESPAMPNLPLPDCLALEEDGFEALQRLYAEA